MAAADGAFMSVCMFGCDNDVDRRPYHRYCDCPLHRSRRPDSSRGGLPRSKSVAFRMKKSWSEGCLALAAAESSAESSPARSPAVGVSAAGGMGSHRRLSSLDEGDEQSVFLKI